MPNERTTGRAPTDQLGSIAPLLLSLKLLKEVCQRPVARQPGREIGGKAIAPDLYAHRLAASHNLPTERGRIGVNLAGHQYTIAPVWLHFLIAEFSISNSLQRELARTRL
jgi:hypothetical protein